MPSDADPVVCVCTPERAHFHLFRSVIERFVAAGRTVLVLTHRDFKDGVERCGGTFVDLFGKYPLAHADDQSRPVPCRYVTYAACYAEALARDLRPLRPALVLYDTFSVIAPVVARALDVPFIQVGNGHNQNPAAYVARLHRDPRVNVSDACRRAVDRLQTEFGWHDASPFSYVATTSPWLNLYPEPPQFLAPAEAAAFAPIAYWGALPDFAPTPPARRRARAGGPRVLVAFGTVVWRYFTADAEQVLLAVARGLGRRAQVTVGLGNGRISPAAAQALAAAGARVHEDPDQWAALAGSDVFVTHHGINSTHEAICRRVPMASCPFFWDQPSLAARCQEFGLAVPVRSSHGQPVGPRQVETAVQAILDQPETFRSNLEQAYQWEVAAMNGRAAVMAAIREAIIERPRGLAGRAA